LCLSPTYQYDWLWKADKDAKYAEFSATSPTLEDYEGQLKSFGEVQKEIEKFSSIHIIGALSLNTKNLKSHLSRECDDWKIKV